MRFLKDSERGGTRRKGNLLRKILNNLEGQGEPGEDSFFFFFER